MSGTQPQTLIRSLAAGVALPIAIAAIQNPAQAVLTLKIFDDGPNLKVSVSGSLSQLPAAAASGSCGVNGALSGEFQTANPSYRGAVCTGADTGYSLYNITGPSGFGGNTFLAGASSNTGDPFWFASSAYTNNNIFKSRVGLSPGYILNSPFFSEAVFNGKSLASEGFSSTPLEATWAINGTSESIKVIVGSPASVPGPLPLIGAGAAFGWSRRLRRRTFTS